MTAQHKVSRREFEIKQFREVPVTCPPRPPLPHSLPQKAASTLARSTSSLAAASLALVSAPYKSTWERGHIMKKKRPRR